MLRNVVRANSRALRKNSKKFSGNNNNNQSNNANNQIAAVAGISSLAAVAFTADDNSKFLNVSPLAAHAENAETETKLDEAVEKVEAAVEKVGDVVKEVEKAVEVVEKEAEKVIEKVEEAVEAGKEAIDAVEDAVAGGDEVKTEEVKSEEPVSEPVSAEETVSEPVSEDPKTEENPFADAPQRTEEEVAAAFADAEKTSAELKSELVAQFEDLKQKTAANVKSACEAESDSAQKIKLHTLLFRSAMDDQSTTAENRAENWQKAGEACKIKDEAREKSLEPVVNAKSSLLEYKALLKQICSEYPELGDELLLADTHYSDMVTALETATIETASRLTEANVMAQYAKRIAEAREQFRDELFSESNLPEEIAKIKDGWIASAEKPEFDKDQLNALLAHAHFQINALKEELNKEREQVIGKMEDAVSSERGQLMAEAEAKVALETDQKLMELQRLHDEKMGSIRRQYEDEAILQLRRQMASHTMHLSDVVDAAKAECTQNLTAIHDSEVGSIHQQNTDTVESLKSSHNESISNLEQSHSENLQKSLASLSGIKGALSERAELESKIENSRKLSIAARSLTRNVMRGNKDLTQAVTVIKNCGDESTNQILENTVDGNLSKGVVPQKQLRKQFFQMLSELQMLQFVPNEASLVDRVVGTIQGQFYYNKFVGLMPRSLAPPKEVVETTDTASYLAYATYCVENGDLEQAARFMAQINGRAAVRAESWISDVCRYEEFKNASKAIATIAEAVSLGFKN
jgi:hypothetical protein